MSQADPLARYVCEAQPLHDLLRRGLLQLSGFLLKRTIAGSRAIVDYEPIGVLANEFAKRPKA